MQLAINIHNNDPPPRRELDHDECVIPALQVLAQAILSTSHARYDLGCGSDTDLGTTNSDRSDPDNTNGRHTICINSFSNINQLTVCPISCFRIDSLGQTRELGQREFADEGRIFNGLVKTEVKLRSSRKLHIATVSNAAGTFSLAASNCFET